MKIIPLDAQAAGYPRTVQLLEEAIARIKAGEVPHLLLIYEHEKSYQYAQAGSDMAACALAAIQLAHYTRQFSP